MSDLRPAVPQHVVMPAGFLATPSQKVYDHVSTGRMDAALRAIDGLARGRSLADSIPLLEALIYRAGADLADELVEPQVEHAAFDVARRALRRLAAQGVWKVPSGARLVAARPACERHDLGLEMVGTLLERDGWTIEQAGTSSPDALVRRVRACGAELVCLAATTVARLGDLERMVEAVHREVPGVRVMVGGLAFRLVPERAVRVGADLFAEDAPAAVATVRA